MKLKPGYLKRIIADTCVIVPIGERVIDFQGMLTLNELGQFIWERISEETDYEALVGAVLDEYDVSEETARADLDAFLTAARECGVLE